MEVIFRRVGFNLNEGVHPTQRRAHKRFGKPRTGKSKDWCIVCVCSGEGGKHAQIHACARTQPSQKRKQGRKKLKAKVKGTFPSTHGVVAHLLDGGGKEHHSVHAHALQRADPSTAVAESFETQTPSIRSEGPISKLLAASGWCGCVVWSQRRAMGHEIKHAAHGVGFCAGQERTALFFLVLRL